MLTPRLIKLLAALIFLGYLMIWCVTPLGTWRERWLFLMLIKTRTKYFGTQGTFMLIFTVPILLIALLGCLYLYLTTTRSTVGRCEDSRVKGGRLAALKRPILVRGPLGIVSAIELFFSLMFIALLVWTFVYVNVRFSIVNNMNPRQNLRHASDKIWQQKLRSTAFYMAIVGNVCSALVFVPVTRMSSILGLLGLTAEGCLKYHIWLGHITMAFFTAHGLLFFVYWAITNDLVEMIKWDKHSVSNVPGEIALLFGLALWATTFPRIRRKMYELFYYTHQLYIPFMFFYMLHVGFRFFCMILPGFYLFLVDRYLRFLQSLRKVQLVSARVLPCDTVELNFSKSLALSYTPTSFVSINVPSVSSMQWHPFTLSSSSGLEPDTLSIIMKKDGNWSSKVIDLVSSQSPPDRLQVSIEGPYGPISTDFSRYQTLVMIAGGSGISPMISIIRDLIFQKTVVGNRTPHMVLICAFKHSVDVTLLNLILPMGGTTMDLSDLDLEIEAFVTRDKHPITNDMINSHIKTVWFRPNSSDEPVSAILGPHSWLWLGAIILSSFVIFLAIIGILGRYYIYPIDKNTDKIYSWSTRAILNAVFMCMSIIVVASIAVLMNKRSKGSTSQSQVQHIELIPSPTNSPSTWVHNPDMDLECLPQQSIIENVKIHYGQRPNLKKMLLEYEGPSTGALVCGPGQMRHEVAAVCSSGLANHLHYESISYTT